MTDAALPIAVLISGGGSNLQALLDSPANGVDFTVAVVISDRDGVQGLERARRSDVKAEVVSWSDTASREAFTNALCDVAAAYGAKGLVLAGFMRILSPEAIDRFPHAIINVHPALLPSFPGARAVENALEYGVTTTGVTVHFVDEHVDHGPIIAQESLAVLPQDDAESLHARIQTIEHQLLPKVVAAFGRGALSVEGRHVHWDHSDKESTRP